VVGDLPVILDVAEGKGPAQHLAKEMNGSAPIEHRAAMAWAGRTEGPAEQVTVECLGLLDVGDLEGDVADVAVSGVPLR
jgi:hypothetical protein